MELNARIAVIGLGYVGLPLAVEFAKKYSVTGYDISQERVQALHNGKDHTLELEEKDFIHLLSKTPGTLGLYCTADATEMADCNFFIITVPTPADKNNLPDLSQLRKATEMVGRILKKGDLVIYESTVYPGVTEEECAPLLEKVSGLKFNIDFFCGYSPERINPGDRLHRISKIIKITAGSTPEVAGIVNALYGSVIEAGTFPAPSIKVAEAAKLVENAQRDINIAFVNELAKIFNLLGIDTASVLEAAGTKWNFHPFKPGLVGGHCIGSAPHYLAQKAREAGYMPDIITAGRKVNDSMGSYIAGETIRLMAKKEIPVKNAKVLIMGFTFKENCPDVRNTRVIDILNELKTFQANVSVWDPWAEPSIVREQYGIEIIRNPEPDQGKYDAVIVAVAHDSFHDTDIKNLVNKRSVIYDVKSVLKLEETDGRL